MLLIRATPPTIEETVVDIAESALDSAGTYVVERPDGKRAILYGVSVFARPPTVGAHELLRRFSASPRYLEASVGDVTSVGFTLLPTGMNAYHFDVQLVGDQTEPDELLPLDVVEKAAGGLIAVAGDLRSNPSYAGSSED